MPITPTTPIVVPARTLDKLWAQRIVIMAPEPNGEAFAEVQLLPYSEAGGAVAPDLVKILDIQGIMARAVANPDSNIAKAMYYLLLAIDDIYKEQNP
jgi:hypothetical protein